jgi:hypothetical protein
MRCEKLGHGSNSIKLFLARDMAGNNHALARRMGIQELIWNRKAWFSGDGGMRWAGARMQTSFWKH